MKRRKVLTGALLVMYPFCFVASFSAWKAGDHVGNNVWFALGCITGLLLGAYLEDA